MAGILLPVCSIFFSILLCIVFFSKKRINLIENNIYSVMLIVSVIDSILVSILQGITLDGVNEIDNILVEALNKIDFIMLMTFVACILLYTLIISFNK